MGVRINLLGKKIGCLTAIAVAQSRLYKKATVGYWVVRCECGKEKEMSVGGFKNRDHKYCSKNCSLIGSAKVKVKCSICEEEYEIKNSSNKKSDSRICRKCVSRIGSNAVRGKKSNNRLPDGESAFNALYGAYKTHAEKIRNIKFDISKEQFRVLTKGLCKYCGSKPAGERKSSSAKSKGKDSGSYIYNGVDRIDSSQGYIIGNVVPCCKRCNFMKSNITESDMYEHIVKILNYSGNRFFHP